MTFPFSLFLPVLHVPDVFPSHRPLLHQLRDDDDDPLAQEQRRRARLQRLRALLQAARGHKAARHEEGWDTGTVARLQNFFKKLFAKLFSCLAWVGRVEGRGKKSEKVQKKDPR